MKISVSLPDGDVAYLDAQGGSRSALLHQAIQLLRRDRLDEQYTQAFDGFARSGDQQLWDRATSDEAASQ